MRQFTTEEINSWGPCYPAEEYLTPGDSHTVLSILDDKRIPFEDRLWVVCRRDLLSEKLMRLFAVWCARQVQHLMGDERSIKALDVSEAFANGETGRAELTAARDAALTARRDAARAATWYAAGAAACEAARAGAYEAARAGACEAARAGARNAAWYAALAATREAAGVPAARAATWYAAGAASQTAQESKLREMIIAGIETGDVK